MQRFCCSLSHSLSLVTIFVRKLPGRKAIIPVISQKVKRWAYDFSFTKKDNLNFAMSWLAEYNAVATIAAALGAHEQGRKPSGVSAIPAVSNNSSSHNSGSSSGGRHSSTSSKPTNDRQRTPTSPQVVNFESRHYFNPFYYQKIFYVCYSFQVLSIVDSDGAEIARSLPRPVQIVRGNQGPSSPPNIGSRSTVSTSETDKQIRSNSTASIVLGSAG